MVAGTLSNTCTLLMVDLSWCIELYITYGSWYIELYITYGSWYIELHITSTYAKGLEHQ